VKDIELPLEDSLNFSMAPKSIIDSLAQELNLKTTFSKILHSFSLKG
jgi:hypothetical protein